MSKVKITWRNGVKEKLHNECRNHFSKLDDNTIAKFFNIILKDK